MQAQIHKWGNSAAIRINKAILEQFNSSIGDTVDIQVVDGEILIKPHTELTLDELLQGSPKEYLSLSAEDQDWLSLDTVGREE